MSKPGLEIVGSPTAATASDGSATISVPIRLARRSGRRLVQILDAPESGRTWDAQKTPLQVALMRAHRWLAMLDEGEAASLSDIARREGTDVSYVARVLNLTAVAPEIIEAILNDTLPNTICLNSISINPALSWHDQISVLHGNAKHAKNSPS